MTVFFTFVAITLLIVGVIYINEQVQSEEATVAYGVMLIIVVLILLGMAGYAMPPASQ